MQTDRQPELELIIGRQGSQPGAAQAGKPRQAGQVGRQGRQAGRLSLGRQVVKSGRQAGQVYMSRGAVYTLCYKFKNNECILLFLCSTWVWDSKMMSLKITWQLCERKTNKKTSKTIDRV